MLDGRFHYGNDKGWFYGRTYITPAGNSIVKQVNKERDEQKSQGQATETTSTTGNPDETINL